MFNWIKHLLSSKETSQSDLSATNNAAVDVIVHNDVQSAAPASSPIEDDIMKAHADWQDGRNQEAKVLLDGVLQSRPYHPDALYLRGLIAHQEGDNAQAIQLVSRAIEEKKAEPAFHFALANILMMEQRHVEAQKHYEQGTQLDPGNAQAWGEWAYSLVQSGQVSAAIDKLRQVLTLQADRQDIRYNLATLLQSLGVHDESIVLLREVVDAMPEHVDAWNNLGTALHVLACSAEAIPAFERVIALQPDHALAWSNLGCALQAARKIDDAKSALQHAIALDPQQFNAYTNLALAERELGRVKTAQINSQRALCINTDVSESVRLATLLPVIGQSAEEIKAWRQRFGEEVDKVRECGNVIDDPLGSVGTCNFNLAYQPECDRILQQKAAQMYLKLAPSLNYTAPHCLHGSKPHDRIRIGFISKFMHKHSIGRTTRGLLANLTQDEFEVFALFVPPLIDDDISQFIRERADHHVVLPGDLQTARDQIAALELDILFYQDIGMDAYTYFLAFSRLAPVQCVTFGHPDTTGIPNMDYWVSTEDFEQEGAAEHYSEQLFLLKNIGTLAYYYRPRLQATTRARDYFNLPEDGTLYICSQALFKFHPDFDAIVAEILRGDPHGYVILVESRNKSWGHMLRERLQHTVPDIYERILFVPGMSNEDFLSLVALADVILDTIYFNGMNTNLEAFAVGVPVVTMPSDMQRGRHTYGMYRHMGIDDCIADSPQRYVEIALRLGQDVAFRNTIREKILARNGALFEDMNVVREFERFFREAHARAITPAHAAANA